MNIFSLNVQFLYQLFSMKDTCDVNIDLGLADNDALPNHVNENFFMNVQAYM